MNKHILVTIALVVIAAAVLAAALRGLPGNPSSDELGTVQWVKDGPLETSNERGRFALTYSIVEEGSLKLALPLARFSTPDLATVNNEYVSLFPPGVSFITAPGYLLGRYFGGAQLGSYAVIALFALANMMLVRSIAKRLGAHSLAANLGGLAFLFATPAFSYGVSLYQHHVSTFLILFSLYVLLRWNSLWSLTAVWFLSGLSVVVDNPNFFLMLPLVLFALGRIIWLKIDGHRLALTLRAGALITFVSVLIPVLLFAWYNLRANDSPWQLSGTLERVLTIGEDGQPFDPDLEDRAVLQVVPESEQSEDKTALGLFDTRNMLAGFYTLIVSPDRGVVRFAPVILLGVIGLGYMKKDYSTVRAVLIGIVGVNVLLYSMFGDPWGGWAFGSRYLIPGYALLAIGLALFLTRWRSTILLLIFLILFGYSAWVNTLGALTSIANPPQAEVLLLEELSGHEEKYTYERNWDFLVGNQSRSFVWQTVARRYVSAPVYHLSLTSVIVALAAAMTAGLALGSNKKKIL